MAVRRDPKIHQRMRLLFDLYQTAEDMFRMRMRREHPEATEEEIHHRIVAWRQAQPYEDKSAKASSSSAVARADRL